jgi:hypothetical protein
MCLSISDQQFKLLFSMPILLGDGIPLFQGISGIHHLLLEGLDSYPNGVIRAVYRNLPSDPEGTESQSD